MSHTRRAGVTAAATALGCLALASPAFGLGFTGLSSAPADPAAGAHSDFTQHIGFSSPGDDVKNLTVHLPPGQVGDPTATPKCTVAQLNSDTCPANTQVGVTTTTADVYLIVPVEQVIQGKVYNLVANPGEPARFGIVLDPDLGDNVVLQAGAALRQSDFGLDTIINGIPKEATGVPVFGTVQLDVKALDLTLFGFANEGTPEEHSFMRNPTSCGEAVTNFEATSYSGATTSTPATGSASFTPTNCPALDFSPELTATLQGVAQGQQPSFSTVIEQEASEAGLKRAEVFLPGELSPNNPALETSCTPAEFQAQDCPAASQKGTATAASPLLTSPLTGEAYLLKLNPTDLGVGLDLHGELAFKLTGKFVFTQPDFRTGNLFEGLPDIPISTFELDFQGGSQGLVSAKRNTCDSPTPSFDYTFDGHNGEQTVGNVPAELTDCPPTATVDYNLEKRRPNVELSATAGSVPLRKARIKLPVPIHFAKGRALKAGTTASDDGGNLPDSALKRKRARLEFETPANDGSPSLHLIAKKGAVLFDKGDAAGSDPLVFKVALTDKNGDVTKLQVPGTPG